MIKKLTMSVLLIPLSLAHVQATTPATTNDKSWNHFFLGTGQRKAMTAGGAIVTLGGIAFLIYKYWPKADASKAVTDNSAKSDKGEVVEDPKKDDTPLVVAPTPKIGKRAAFIKLHKMEHGYQSALHNMQDFERWEKEALTIPE